MQFTSFKKIQKKRNKLQLQTKFTSWFLVMSSHDAGGYINSSMTRESLSPSAVTHDGDNNILLRVIQFQQECQTFKDYENNKNLNGSISGRLSHWWRGSAKKTLLRELDTKKMEFMTSRNTAGSRLEENSFYETHYCILQWCWMLMCASYQCFSLKSIS